MRYTPWGNVTAARRVFGGIEMAMSRRSALVCPRAWYICAMLRGMGPLRTVELLEVKADGERRYRLAFKYKAVVWTASAAADGRLTRFRPE